MEPKPRVFLPQSISHKYYWHCFPLSSLVTLENELWLHALAFKTLKHEHIAAAYLEISTIRLLREKMSNTNDWGEPSEGKPEIFK